MPAVLVLIFSLYIAVRDIKYHRIYNQDLAIFALLLSVELNVIPFRQIAFCIAASLSVSLIFKCGGGDFKLSSLLFLTQGEITASTKYFSLLFLSLSAALIISAAYRRSFRGAIPLAPSILLPFLVIYLDI